MKTALLFTGTGPIVVATSFGSLEDPKVLESLKSKGIPKFLAYEVPAELVAQRFGGHFDAVMHDVHETDDLRILEDDGERAFNMFKFSELGQTPIVHEGD